MVVLLIIIYITHSEIGSQDCLNYKCHSWIDTPTVDTPIDENIEKIINMIQNSYTLVGWRRSIIIGLVLSFIITKIVLYNYNLGWREYFIVSIIIMVFSYTAYQWMQLHWLKPIGWKAENIITGLYFK